MIHFITLSLFPEMFKSPLDQSIFKKGVDQGLLKVTHFNIRDFTLDKHKRVDDYTYGGGAGLLLMAEPIFLAIEHIKKDYNIDQTIFFSPTGEPLKTELVKKYIPEDNIDKTYLLLCGRYEGVDQRVRDNLVDKEISIGDYILSGGELAALVFMDSVSRYVKGVLGNELSLDEESFNNNLLEYPQYTRPADFRGMKVPDILLSGHHEKIKLWREEKQKDITKKIRPDLKLKEN